MAALKFSFYFFLFVLVHAVFLLPHLVNCDEEDDLLQGINSYRTSLNLPVLTKNKKAECLADKIAEELEDRPCTNTNTNLRGTSPQLPEYNNLVNKCDIDINTTSDGVVLPVCVPKLVPTLVLTNYTHSSFMQYLNNSKYTGAGVGSEDDWMVVILTTNSPTGSFVSAANSVVLKIGSSYCSMMYLLLGFVVFLLY